MRDQQEDKISTPVEFLRDLAERIMHVPVMYGVDQGDTERLISIARAIDALPNLLWDGDVK